MPTAEPDDVSPVDDERTDFVVFDVEFSADSNAYRNELSRLPPRSGIIETAGVLRYLAEDDPPTAVDELDHIVAILFKLCR